MNVDLSVLEGIVVPETKHLGAIPKWWWLISPKKAFDALRLMKENVSAKVVTGTPESTFSTGVGGSDVQKAEISLKEGINLPLVGEVQWKEVIDYVLDWVSNPLNVALTFWCILCIIPTAIIILVDGGFLDTVLTDELFREELVEVSDQILNALFVLMCLVWHPVFFRLSYQLYRWNPSDIEQLRYEYCRKGTRKPDEWWHLSVIFFWFHVTCIATYALAIIYWVYPRWNRPWWAVVLSVAVSFGSPIVAFTYNILSPLGNDFHLEVDQETTSTSEANETGNNRRSSKEHFKEFDSTFILSQKVVPYPEWRGGLFDCLQSPRIAVLTCLFPFCIFGCNTERLGFGQFWVQTSCFIFIVVGPFFVFQLSVHTTRLMAFARILTYCGIVLAWTGLLYGAYWRFRMRKKFRLPASKWCLGSSVLTDGIQWLFCCWCTLCQEVRTAEFYDVGENIFLEKSDDERKRQEQLESLPGLGQASKKVVKFRENIEGGLKDAGKGVVKLLSHVALGSKSSSGNLSDLEHGNLEESSSSSGTSGAVTSPPRVQEMGEIKKV